MKDSKRPRWQWEGLHAPDGIEWTEERTPRRPDDSTPPRSQLHLISDWFLKPFSLCIKGPMSPVSSTSISNPFYTVSLMDLLMISFFIVLPTCSVSALPEPFTNMLAAEVCSQKKSPSLQTRLYVDSMVSFPRDGLYWLYVFPCLILWSQNGIISSKNVSGAHDDRRGHSLP